MPDPHPIVIIGGGHAAAQLCASLVEAGQGARVQLVCGEAELPYQRPPLSKGFLQASADALPPLQWHRPEAWYAEHGIALHRGDPALAIDRAATCVTLRSGSVLRYDRLVLATGRARAAFLACANRWPTSRSCATPPTHAACGRACRPRRA